MPPGAAILPRLASRCLQHETEVAEAETGPRGGRQDVLQLIGGTEGRSTLSHSLCAISSSLLVSSCRNGQTCHGTQSLNKSRPNAGPHQYSIPQCPSGLGWAEQVPEASQIWHSRAPSSLPSPICSPAFQLPTTSPCYSVTNSLWELEAENAPATRDC